MTPIADVYRRDTLIAQFRGEASEIVLESVESGWISVHLPFKSLPYRGNQLPPFFLNLLPEGARLQLLLDSAKSKDDELELLLRTGWDTVGDISVVPHGQPLSLNQVATISRDSAELDFWEEFRNGAIGKIDAAVPGVQEKLSDAAITIPISLRSTPSAILKLEPGRFPNIVNNEHFFMELAGKCGLPVAKTKIITDRNGNKGLLVMRFDRVRNGARVEKLHQEDGCQLLNLPPSQKYKAQLRSIADQVVKISGSPIVDILKLMNLIAYSYVIGNGDLHAKNISMLWKQSASLSPAYDLLSTLPYPLDQGMALHLNGKDKNLKLQGFLDFASHYDVPKEALKKSIERIVQTVFEHVGDLDQIGFDQETTNQIRKEIERRLVTLSR